MKNIKGITLISLVITIIVLIILSSVGIYLTLGNNGIINKAQYGKNETIKQTATEKMNLKITNTQIDTYAREQRMPTLQEFSDVLCEDNEIEYVELQSKMLGALDKIEVGDASSIFTKLKEYPYEFEINSSLQLASIDGIQTNIKTADFIKLLWTNQNPSSAFKEQTITMDLSNYEAVLIHTKSYYSYPETTTSTNYPSYTYGKIGETIYCTSGAKGTSGVWYTTFRPATILSTGIEFGPGNYGQSSSNYSGDTVGIPLFIWGVKKDIYAQ